MTKPQPPYPPNHLRALNNLSYWVMAYDADETYYSDGPFADEEHALRDLYSWARKFYQAHGDEMKPDVSRQAAQTLALMKMGREDSDISDNQRDTQYLYQFAGMKLEVYTSL